MSKPRRISTLSLILISIFVIIIVLITHSYFQGGLFKSWFNGNVSEFIEAIRSLGALSQIALVLIVIAEVVFAPIPPLVVYIAGGVLFGGLYGGILVLIGNIIGAYIDFTVARNFLGERFETKINKKFKEKFNNYFKKYGGISIFILRINPLTSSDIVSYLAGFTKIRPTRFLIATALGLIPLIFVQTYLGGSVIGSNIILTTITLLFSIFYLIIFLYFSIIALSKRHKKHLVHTNKTL